MNSAIKILLYPISIIYGLITFLRNRLYDWTFLKENHFDIHTIGVGNLSVGGAGKTPLVEYLIRLLLQEDSRIATLSRGYKRKTKGFILATDTSTVQEIGDEPLLYKLKYPILVAVDDNRVSGIKNLMALEKKSPRYILLDDVFQHRAIKCGLNIVVSDFNNLYFNDMMLPSGTLREYKSEIIRADVIVISKIPDKITAIELRNLLKDIDPKAYQQVFFSYLKYGELYSISNLNEKIHTLNDLYRYRIICFSGIASADLLINYLKEYSAEVKHLTFSDHYEYSIKDLEDIERYYHSFKGGNKIMVTTEKDLMRLKNIVLWPIAERMNIYILPVEVNFKDKENEFNEMIFKYARTNRFHHQKYS